MRAPGSLILPGEAISPGATILATHDSKWTVYIWVMSVAVEEQDTLQDPSAIGPKWCVIVLPSMPFQLVMRTVTTPLSVRVPVCQYSWTQDTLEDSSALGPKCCAVVYRQ